MGSAYFFPAHPSPLKIAGVGCQTRHIGTSQLSQVTSYFWSLASIFPRAIVDLPHAESVGEKNLSEYVVAKSLQQLGMQTCKLKTEEGHNIVNHIGEYSIGKRAEPGDPRYEDFAAYDPETKYSSRHGTKWT